MDSESTFAQFPGWKLRLTAEEYTPLNGEKLPGTLVTKLLLKLYELFFDCGPQRGIVLRRTLAACRLVCRKWDRIVKSTPGRFFIRAYDKEWPSLSPAHPIIPHHDTVYRFQDKGGIKTYTKMLSKYHPKFLPELLKYVMPGLYRRRTNGTAWKDEDRAVTRRTLAACCLVSREWTTISTSFLYGDICLGGRESLLTRYLLHRTFQQTHPAHKALVKTVTIAPAEDGSTANLLSICLNLPNLSKLLLKFDGIDLSELHPDFTQQLRSLPKCCTIKIVENQFGEVVVDWELLPSYINFTRRLNSTSRNFKIKYADGR